MKKRFTEQQIMAVLKEGETGVAVKEICRKQVEKGLMGRQEERFNVVYTAEKCRYCRGKMRPKRERDGLLAVPFSGHATSTVVVEAARQIMTKQ